MTRKIRMKRGPQLKLPQLDIAEIGFTTDTEQTYIGTGTKNIELAKKESVEELISQMSETVTDLKLGEKSLVRNSDFEKTPSISSRSAVYQFTSGITQPQHQNKKSLKIEAVNYETSSDENKDFAFLLTEKILTTEKLRVSFWAYPLSSSKSIRVRMAFGTSVTVNLGTANQWNKIDFLVDLSSVTQENNYLYFNFNSSYTLFMSDLKVSVDKEKTSIPISFADVNQRLSEMPSTIRNSEGVVSRLISVAQTYLNNVNLFSYGNQYTAYDANVQMVGGKYQIDCSSFANLLIRGVTFENSRYNGNSVNKGSNLFFQNTEPLKFRYANEIARYASEKGYAFLPKSDFSNIEPGDVLFFSWDNGVSGDLNPTDRENAFMQIDHVGVYLHRKNESTSATLQFDNGITSVFVDSNNNYMRQCVMAARFPYANVENSGSDSNLLLDGDIAKNVTNTSVVHHYKLATPLKKGNYYTFFINGQVLTESCYFVLQVNGKTVYSDTGKTGNYIGVTSFKFPYLLDDVANTITLAIGGPAGITNRSANVVWSSLYEGYVRDKRYYQKPANISVVRDFPLNAALIPDLESASEPYYKYVSEGNKLFINFSLPFTTLRTGTLVLGTMPSDLRPNSNQMIPINLVGANNEAINAALRFRWNGEVAIIPYDNAVQWRRGIGHGFIFLGQ